MDRQALLERARELRDDPHAHYNCAQAVLAPFAEQEGLGFERAVRLTANFGAGMRVGLTCGAITGGLMALGLCGATGPRDSAEFFARMREKHEGRSDCRDLLAAEVRGGAQKKPHCDAMVYEAVEIACDILEERGLLG